MRSIVAGITLLGLLTVPAHAQPLKVYILAGSSNAGFHYLGSAKMLGQIGRAFAEAILNMREVP